jgi:hypothetical protein
MTTPGAGNGLQITFGFLVFWMLGGWAILGETLAPDNPNSRAPGRFVHVLGQAFALIGLTCLALLCAHALSPIVKHHDLEFLPLGVTSALYLLEALWILFGHPLPRERSPLERLSFGNGRDLVLRNGSTLFLGQGLLATVQGPRMAALQASGICLGWGFSVLIWDLRRPLSTQRTFRFVLAPIAFLTGLLLFSRAWRSWW